MSTGSPDWQLYQSSAGAPVYNITTTGGSTSPLIYLGEWRSLHVTTPGVGTSTLWGVSITWYSDKAKTYEYLYQTIVIAPGSEADLWVPVITPYMVVQVGNYTIGSTDSLTLYFMPALLPPLKGIGAGAGYYVSWTTEVLSAGNSVTIESSYVRDGMATLSVYVDCPNQTIELQSANELGGWDTFWHADSIGARKTQQFDIAMPQSTVRISLTNNDAIQKSNWDIALSPR